MNPPKKVCKTCLATDDPNGASDFVNIDDCLLHMLTKLVPELPVEKSSSICTSCCLFLEAAWMFRKTCKATLKKLNINYNKRKRKKGPNKKSGDGENCDTSRKNKVSRVEPEIVESVNIVFNDASTIVPESDKKQTVVATKESILYSLLRTNNKINNNRPPDVSVETVTIDISDDSSNDTVILGESDVDATKTPTPTCFTSILTANTTNHSTNSASVSDDNVNVNTSKCHEYIDLEELQKFLDKYKSKLPNDLTTSTQTGQIEQKNDNTNCIVVD